MSIIAVAFFWFTIIASHINSNLSKPVVLTYHSIMDEPASECETLFLRRADFEEQVAFLKSNGYKFLFAHEYETPCRKGVIITFDDGYKDNLSTALPVLEKYDAKATIFVSTGLIGGQLYLSEQDISLMAKSPLISFGSHTVTHPDLTSLSDKESISKEFSESKEVLESLTGRSVTAIAYPFGTFNNAVTDVASEHFDFCYATSWGCGKDLFSISRITIDRETEISTFKQYFSPLSRIADQLEESTRALYLKFKRSFVL